ncbi:MAG TPA: hypothetical protein VF721_13515 [Pyrinomonadaceae bacterium]|jgi:hypothetical protein
MKNLLFILITVAAFGTTGCLPLNFAQSSRTESRNALNENRNNQANEDSSLTAETVAPENKAKASPTPKREPKKISNAVCPDPEKPCHHAEREFADWELPFKLPAKIVANKTYSSRTFYAVIIRKYDEACGDEMDYDSRIERERLRIQKAYPERKVFAEYSCPNMDAVHYDFAGKRDASGERVLYMDYIAIYAGETEEEANQILKEAREDFSQATLKKMTANYERLEM